MKIITVNPSSEAYGLIADSALNLPGRPVFLPDIPEVAEWKASFFLAVKICRLGKTIKEKFAHRYFDRISLAMRLTPVGPDGNTIGAIASVSDFALTLGEWTEIPTEEFSIIANSQTAHMSGCREIISRSIENLSRIATLKIGDIILLPIEMPAVPVAIGDRFEGSIAGSQIFSCRIR